MQKFGEEAKKMKSRHPGRKGGFARKRGEGERRKGVSLNTTKFAQPTERKKSLGKKRREKRWNLQQGGGHTNGSSEHPDKRKETPHPPREKEAGKWGTLGVLKKGMFTPGRGMKQDRARKKD